MAVKGSIGTDHYSTQISNGSIELVADEPLEKGGKAAGFEPSDLLSAALVACTCITLRMYADRKGWDLEEVQTEVSFHRDIEKDETSFVRSISLKGALTDNEKEQLLAVANKCPIHKTLSSTISINTHLQ